MRIAVQSKSTAVCRVLEAAITAAGHRVAPITEAELTLRDGLHPSQTLDSAPECLELVGESADAGSQSITCPIHPAALIQRLTSLSGSLPQALGGGWLLDVRQRGLSHPQAEPLPLTEKECQLLQALAEAQPTGLSREALLEAVWGVNPDMDTHTLETHIYRLRHKLEGLDPAGAQIASEQGTYRLVSPA